MSYQLEKEDIQGLVARGHGNTTQAHYFLVSIDAGKADQARTALRDWLDKVDRVQNPVENKRGYMILGFTWQGLQKFKDKPLRHFDIAFREGMSGRNNDHRARQLGDTEHNDRQNWQWGSDNEIDLLIIVFGNANLEDTRTRISDFASHHTHIIGNNDKEEPFGFRDGISQPGIRGFRAVDNPEFIKPGEFILGYPNESDIVADVPQIGDDETWGRNATYLVLRQLEQDVERFRELTDDNAELGARIIGRWKSGTPLVLAPDTDQPSLGKENEFGYYDNDQYGFTCPLGAHIRRANPRDTPVNESMGHTKERAMAAVRRHRLLRRGRVYESEDTKGLLFAAINASIEDQFEFVQHQWINNTDFNGLSGEDDPLTGRRSTLTIQDPYARQTMTLDTFVRVRGGAYFILPGIRALQSLIY